MQTGALRVHVTTWEFCKRQYLLKAFQSVALLNDQISVAHAYYCCSTRGSNQPYRIITEHVIVSFELFRLFPCKICTVA